MLAERREPKRAKLIQYAERVWGIEGDEEAKIDGAIAATRDFFQAPGRAHPPRRPRAGRRGHPQVLAQLERHGMTALSERRDLDLDASERILLRAL